MLAILLPSLGFKNSVFLFMLWLFQLCYCLLLKAFNLEEPANWYILLGAIILSVQTVLAFDKFYVQIMHGSFF
jgi:hypothetical protein